MGAWELGGGPQDWRGEPQEAGGGPQELEDELQEEGGGPQEAGGGSQGLGDAHLGPVGGPKQLVGVPLGPVGGLQQMEEGGRLGLQDGLLELEGEPQEQGDGPQMMVGGLLVLGDGPQELEGGPQMLEGGPLVLAGGHQGLGGAAGEGPGALRVQAHWVAWGAEAGLLVEAEAKTQAAVVAEANRSSVGVAVFSLQEAQQAGLVGQEAFPS